jgi:hypothetical protein
MPAHAEQPLAEVRMKADLDERADRRFRCSASSVFRPASDSAKLFDMHSFVLEKVLADQVAPIAERMPESGLYDLSRGMLGNGYSYRHKHLTLASFWLRRRSVRRQRSVT